MTAHAELDGLGPADGPVVTWTVPEDFARAKPPVGRAFDFMPAPASPGKGAHGWGLWLGLAFLLLLVALLLSRTGSKGPLR